MIRREGRGGGEGEERGLRKGAERGYRKETKRNLVNNLKRRIRNIDTCLCLFPQGRHCVSSEFPTRFCSNGLQQ